MKLHAVDRDWPRFKTFCGQPAGQGYVGAIFRRGVTALPVQVFLMPPKGYAARCKACLRIARP